MKLFEITKRLALTYRCGYCGQPTDTDGIVLSVDEIKAMGKVDWDKAEQTAGECCRYHKDQDEQERRDWYSDTYE